MLITRRSELLPYAAVLVAIPLALVLRLTLWPLLGAELPFLLLWPAVMFCAWYGGMGPGIASTALSATAGSYLLLEPHYSLALAAPADGVGIFLFVLLGLFISGLVERSKRAKRLAEKRAFELFSQREWFRITLSSIGDAVIATDTESRVTFMNAVAEKLTGWTAADAEGVELTQVFKIVNQTSRLPVDSPVAKALREGVVVGLANHTVLIARDGGERHIDDSAAPIRDEVGAMIGAVLVFRDITEQRRAELEYHSLQERFRRADEARLHLAAIVENSDDAIIGQSLEGRVQSWNAAAEEHYGYTWEEIQDKPLSLLFPSGNARQLTPVLERLRAGERTKPVETSVRCKDGTLVAVSANCSPVRDIQGEITGMSLIVRDIRERKQIERTLRFLNDVSTALAALIDYESSLQKVAGLAVPFFADWCLVYMVDDNGRVQRAAEAQANPGDDTALFQCNRQYPADAKPASVMLRVLQGGHTEVLADLSDDLLHEIARDEEHLSRLRKLHPHSFIGVPLVIRNRLVGAVGFLRSGARRQYRAGDRNLAEDLARRAATAIENARLYEELQEKDRRKDEFLAMLAHELRNPLAPMQNALQLLKISGVEATNNEARAMLERQVQHLIRLVDDLLDVSRVMRGKIELRKERVELAAVVNRAVESARPVIDAQGHELVVSLPDQTVPFLGDPIRLAQVISNLLTNSAKYTENKGWIHLIGEQQGADIVIRVRDNGVGISPEMLPHVFDLFTQADRSLTRSQGGLGIGLTLVQRLVRLHGGDVEAHSAGLGQGSEFVVRLPIGAIEDGESSEPADYEAAASSQRRILVVDDNVDAVTSLAMLLRLAGHEVQAAYDGTAALELLEVFRPEVVLLDIGMPHMSGYEVAQCIRERIGPEKMLLVAMTGWGQEEDRRRSHEAGFDHHLVKPVDLLELQKLLAAPAKQGNPVKLAQSCE